MSTTDRESTSADRVPGAGLSDVPDGAAMVRAVDDDSIWLDGDVLSCACPDCRAPMSIRLWLRVADCWRCGASIELTEAQHRKALQLLKQREQSQPAPAGNEPQAAQPSPPTPSASIRPAPLLPAPTATPLARLVTTPGAPESTPPPAASTPASPPIPPPLPAADGVQFLRQAWGGLWRDLPSWLASLVVHMAAMILLGLWLLNPHERPKPLVLATGFNGLNTPGDDTVVDVPTEGVEFDTPGVLNPEAVTKADAFAKDDLSLGVDIPATQVFGLLSGTADLRLPAIGPNELGKVLLGRDPRVRSHLALRGGGTIESEAAVARALKWIAAHQNSDGSWSLHAFDHTGTCHGQCSMPGLESDTAGTALALLPFLGAGQTQLQGEYTGTVARGLRWLIEAETDAGDLRGRGGGRMYAHGQAAIALCEAFALTQDRNLAEPAQRAIDFIVRAQHRRGGWRYQPGQAGDTSVVGWQLMALRSAQMAYLKVPADAFTKAGKFLDSVQTEPSIGLYGYMPGTGPSDAMTAEGLLCRQYSGWRRNHSPMIGGIQWLLRHHPPRASDANMYYWYYATQAMHHVGGRPWEEWNGQLRDLLVSMQERIGHEAGSWSPRGGHDLAGGRLYMTALAACTLEVYYRHLPLYGTSAVEMSGK